MNERKFWPFYFDPEGEIYENLSWDLPGYRLQRKARQSRRKRAKSGPNEP
jgi:hypothetical protein